MSHHPERIKTSVASKRLAKNIAPKQSLGNRKPTNPKFASEAESETSCGSLPMVIRKLGLIGDVLYMVVDRSVNDVHTPGGTQLHVIDTPHLSLKFVDVSGKLARDVDLSATLESRLPELTAMIMRLEKEFVDRADRDGLGRKDGV